MKTKKAFQLEKIETKNRCCTTNGFFSKYFKHKLEIDHRRNFRWNLFPILRPRRDEREREIKKMAIVRIRASKPRKAPRICFSPFLYLLRQKELRSYAVQTLLREHTRFLRQRRVTEAMSKNIQRRTKSEGKLKNFFVDRFERSLPRKYEINVD